MIKFFGIFFLQESKIVEQIGRIWNICQLNGQFLVLTFPQLQFCWALFFHIGGLPLPWIFAFVVYSESRIFAFVIYLESRTEIKVIFTDSDLIPASKSGLFREWFFRTLLVCNVYIKVRIPTEEITDYISLLWIRFTFKWGDRQAWRPWRP